MKTKLIEINQPMTYTARTKFQNIITTNCNLLSAELKRLRLAHTTAYNVVVDRVIVDFVGRVKNIAVETDYKLANDIVEIDCLEANKGIYISIAADLVGITYYPSIHIILNNLHTQINAFCYEHNVVVN